MKKLAYLGVAAGLGLGALLVVTHKSQAADHLDAPTIKMAANKMADIGDVYAWMTSDATKVNLAMTVSPADDGTNMFGPTIQYVFHVTSSPGFGMPGTESKVICTFTNNTAAQCWLEVGTTTRDYVTGDPSGTIGLTSKSGKMKLFAGQRSDPFFFNLGGFDKAQAFVEANSPLPADAAGCPTITKAIGDTLRTDLSTVNTAAIGPCAANQIDCFANFNVMAIVLQIDKTELNVGSNTLLSVWGSTHMKQ